MRRYIFKRSGLDYVGGGSPISYLEVTGSAALIKAYEYHKFKPLFYVQYDTSAQSAFFATKLLPKLHTCKVRISGLSASHFAPDCENAEESTSGLNSLLVRLTYSSNVLTSECVAAGGAKTKDSRRA